MTTPDVTFGGAAGTPDREAALDVPVGATAGDLLVVGNDGRLALLDRGSVGEPVDRITIPGDRFWPLNAVEGSGFQRSNDASYTGWQFPDALDRSVGTHLELPIHWEEWAIYLHTSARTATTDAVRWRVVAGSAGVGDVPANVGVAGEITQAYDGTVHRVTETLMTNNRPAPASGAMQQIVVTRRGTNAADSFTGNAFFYRAVLERIA